MNPTGLVPTLQEDDFTLWESNAILRYLCNAHAPDSTTWPRDQHARANVDRWLDAQQTVMNRPQGTIFINMVRTPPEKRDQAAIAQAITEAAARLGDDRGGTREAPVYRRKRTDAGRYRVGRARASVVHHGFARPEIPNLRAWYDRLLARPVYKEHIARPLV